MKLDPVYLIAPEPEPPKVTRRSALLGIVLATIAGGAAGFFVGRATLAPAPPDDQRGERDWWLSWALDHAEGRTSDAEIMNEWTGVLQVVELRAAEEPRLWDGAARIGVLLVERGTKIERSELIARRLLALLQRRPDQAPAALTGLIPQLQRMAR